MPRSTLYIAATLLLFTVFSVAQAQDKIIDSLLVVLKTLPDDTNRVICLNELAANYGEIDVKKEIETAYEALTIAKQINYEKGIAMAYTYLASGYTQAGNHGKSIEYLLKALRIEEKLKDLPELARTYHDIGIVYGEDGKTEKAIQYYEKAVELWQRLGNTRGPVTALYNLGTVYEQQNNDTLAFEYYTEAITKGKAIGNYTPVIFSLINISVICMKQKNYAAAKQFADEARTLATAYNSDDNILAEIYGIDSEIYLAQGKTQEALAAVKRGLAIAESAHRNSYVLANYKRLANIYQSTGNSAKAYEALSRYMALNDSIRNESNRVSIEQMMQGYELEKKDMQLAAHTQKYEADAFRRNAIIGLLVSLLLLTLLIYNRTKLILASKQQLLKHYTQNLLEKSTIIASITEELEQLKGSAITVDDNMVKFGEILRLKVHTEEDWESFKKAFNEVYPRFFSNLRYKYPAITAAELRLAAITKLNLSIKEAATMLGISTESVKQSRYRLKKRIEVPENLSLKVYLETHF